MYNTGDKVTLDNYPGQSWIIEKRFITCQDRQYHNMPLIDSITVASDCDTGMVYTLIGCHADDLGCLSCETQLDKVLSCLYCPMVLCCHPGIVQSNYASIWSDVAYCGLWTGETIAFEQDGMLYVCSEVV